MHQVHDTGVVVATAETASGLDADAIVTADPDLAVAVRTADCAPIALAGDGVVGVVHAGWRGLVLGVIEETVRVMRAQGSEEVVAALGPCIHSECYEFGEKDIEVLTDRFGHGVAGRTTEGRPAFDLPAAVRVALERDGIALAHESTACTACSGEHWSHRARGDSERQATVVALA